MRLALRDRADAEAHGPPPSLSEVFHYCAWRLRLWMLNVPGLNTYDAIDQAVKYGRVKPGWLPDRKEETQG